MANVRNKVNIAIRNTECQFCSFNGLTDEHEHFALVFRGADREDIPTVRLHSECITGDLFGSRHCDCGDQLQESIELFSQSGGIILYLRQEGRGIGLYNKLDAYALQNQGLDTFEANRHLNFPEDMRDYKVAAEMLFAMEIKQIHLRSNNPDKYEKLLKYGIHIKAWESTGTYYKPENKNYLMSKIFHKHHRLADDNRLIGFNEYQERRA